MEIDKVVEAYNMLNHGYPDNLDSLAGSANGVYVNLPATTGGTASAGPCGGDLIGGTLTTAEVTALNNAGIANVWSPDTTHDGTQQLLTSPYGGVTTGTALAAGPAAVLAGTTANPAMQTLYNEPATGSNAKYVVFGFGSKASIVGNGVPESPVHFADDPGDLGNPQLTYARYGLVFRVTNTAGRTLDSAQFVGAVAFHPDHVSSGDAGLAEAAHLNN